MSGSMSEMACFHQSHVVSVVSNDSCQCPRHCNEVQSGQDGLVCLVPSYSSAVSHGSECGPIPTGKARNGCGPRRIRRFLHKRWCGSASRYC
jgi:hypothetical protein